MEIGARVTIGFAYFAWKCFMQTHIEGFYCAWWLYIQIMQRISVANPNSKAKIVYWVCVFGYVNKDICSKVISILIYWHLFVSYSIRTMYFVFFRHVRYLKPKSEHIKIIARWNERNRRRRRKQTNDGMIRNINASFHVQHKIHHRINYINYCNNHLWNENNITKYP